jgi:hypothetical protein
MAKDSQALALPDNVFGLLAEADKQRGFPPGTMQALLMQETSGQAKYLSDPTAYHYAANAEGKRIAGHTGKISTAYGPFGILESTAKDPGYGVKPMGDKTSLAEHIRFAGDYLAARSKAGGGLSAGLAGYGEGEKYAAQVEKRRGNAPAVAPVVPEPVVQVAQAPAMSQPVPAPVVLAQAEPAPTPVAQAPVTEATASTETVAQAQTNAPTAPVYPTYQNPDFMAALGSMLQQTKPNFQAFGTFGPRTQA